MNYYPFNIGDYAKKTRHLSWDEDMAYRRLLDVYYSREAPLPLDLEVIYRLTLCKTAKHKASIVTILNEFFLKTDYGFENSKCEEVLGIKRKSTENQNEKSENVNSRQQRHREERKQLFEKLKSLGISLPYNTKTETLRVTLEGRNESSPVTRNDDDVQRLYNNQKTITNNQKTKHNITSVTGDAEEAALFKALDAALQVLPNLTNHPIGADPNISPIYKLVQQGYSIETEILPVIKSVMAKKTRIGAWSYFVSAIIENREKTGQQAKPAQSQVVDENTWARRLHAGRNMQMWDHKYGPHPNHPNCKIPPNLLLPTDGYTESGESWPIFEPKT